MAGEARQILARNLRLLRFHRRWSQETLGLEAGLHRTYISQVEKGKSNISLDNVEKLAHAFGLSVSDLLRQPDGTMSQDVLPASSGSGNSEK